ncbi:uncharacterized protein LOC141632329 [Silene latifolia]|uniref:uncharacterized protein LOC141632329 n=1 Tax=Silene latifolia TaxID=37657 RepID=UPI003D776CA1
MEIVGNDVVDAVKEFFTLGNMLKQIISTTLTLIFKKTRPETVADFRTIACCNVVYKIISMVICNRVAAVLPSIINETQSAFIKGRDIVDNILICHDLVRLYKRKACSPRCIMKVDLKKAYESIEFRFIEQMLQALKFPDKMVRGDRGSVSILLRVFATFSAASGLARNNENSEIYFNGMAPAEVDYMLHISGSKDRGSMQKLLMVRIRSTLEIPSSGLGENLEIHLWLASKSDHMWIKSVDHVYMKGRDWQEYTPTTNSSWTWRKICQVKDIMKAGYVNGNWSANNGVYSVSSGYKWLLGQQNKVPWLSLVWNKTSIPKHSFIGWLAIQERLLTKDRLLKFGVISDGLCFLYHHYLETHQHLLYDCHFSQQC